MARKTERLYATATLDGTDWTASAHSFALALQNLAERAHGDGREALFDTLEVQIERAAIDNRTLTGGEQVDGYATITVSAEAVKVSETTTTKRNE